MEWSLKRVEDPSEEPVTLSQLKKNIHVTYSDQDEVFDSYIKAAREAAENYQYRSYMPQKWEIVLDEFPTGEICLLRGPVVAVESVIVTDEDGVQTNMDLSNFVILTDNTPGRMVLKNSSSWPSVTLQQIGGIRIRYSTGYGDAASVPETMKNAIIMLCSYWDDNRAVEDVEIPDSFYHLLSADRIWIDEPVS